MIRANPHYKEFQPIPGKRYIFIIDQRDGFIASSKQLEGTFIGIETDWKNAAEDLPLLNPPKCYRFRTDDGTVHDVPCDKVTGIVVNPTERLYIPKELQEHADDIDKVLNAKLDALARNIERQIPRDLINWDRRCEEMTQGKVVYDT